MKIKAMAALLVMGAAACGDTVTNPVEETGGTPPSGSGINPSAALANSTANDCPQRCGFPLKEKAGLTGSLVMALGVTEGATVLFANDRRPAQWSLSGGKKEFGAPTGYAYPEPLGQNGWGQVAGFSYGAQNKVVTVWEPNGAAIALADRPYGGQVLEGQANAISDNSVIVGTSSGRAFRSHYQEGFRWLAPAGSGALDVNQKGEVAGYSTVGGVRRATLWAQDGTAKDLGILPGYASSEAVAISETGIVVGFSANADVQQGFIWSAADGLLSLPAGFVPRDVNHWGEVAGELSHYGHCGVYYKGYGLLMLPFEDGYSWGCTATSINSWGDVVGNVLSTGVHRLHSKPTVWTWAGNQNRYGF